MRTLVSAVAATMLFCAVSAPVQAQKHPEAANASKFGIAVVDISFIFKEYKTFVTTMEQMKKEMEGIETQLKGKRDSLAKLEQERNRLNPGTAEYRQTDDQLATESAKFKLEMDRLRKDLMARESKVYYKTYQQISYAIENYAKQRNIGLVLRFNGVEPDPNKPPEILKDINKPVVFENNIDITRDILEMLNGGSAANVGGNPNPGLQRR